ncbi:WbqC family protein [Haloarcula sp. CGMCC 1.2071]|uniref:WbqC family protein n=1 Tax=Haloarcula sp. CGMCC 1.2071 TaxID=3111454 RepID=UPI00300ED22E
MSRVMTVWQPLYLPKLHYFARLARSDVFVIFDDAEFTRSSRQHRTKIDFQNSKWLTIPVKRSDDTMRINEAPLDMSQDWISKHTGTLQAKYGGGATDILGEYYDRIDDDSHLSEITVPLLKRLLEAFDIDIEIYHSSTLDVPYKKGEPSVYNARLTDHFDCDTYFCGANAYNAYLREEPFEARDLDIRVQDWKCPWPDGNVIALDALFGTDDHRQYIE